MQLAPAHVAEGHLSHAPKGAGKYVKDMLRVSVSGWCIHLQCLSVSIEVQNCPMGWEHTALLCPNLAPVHVYQPIVAASHMRPCDFRMEWVASASSFSGHPLLSSRLWPSRDIILRDGDDRWRTPRGDLLIVLARTLSSHGHHHCSYQLPSVHSASSRSPPSHTHTLLHTVCVLWPVLHVYTSWLSISM